MVVSQAAEALQQIFDDAAEIGVPVLLEDREWDLTQNGGTSIWHSGNEQITFDAPGLPGKGNLSNIGAAITAVSITAPAALGDDESVRQTLHDIAHSGSI